MDWVKYASSHVILLGRLENKMDLFAALCSDGNCDWIHFDANGLVVCEKAITHAEETHGLAIIPQEKFTTFVVHMDIPEDR